MVGGQFLSVLNNFRDLPETVFEARARDDGAILLSNGHVL